MSDLLFQHRSPLAGWFILIKPVTAAWSGGFWYGLLHNGVKPWNRPNLGAVATVLFIISNVLLVRHRRWAAAGLSAGWLLMLGWLTI